MDISEKFVVVTITKREARVWATGTAKGSAPEKIFAPSSLNEHHHRNDPEGHGRGEGDGEGGRHHAVPLVFAGQDPGAPIARAEARAAGPDICGRHGQENNRHLHEAPEVPQVLSRDDQVQGARREQRVQDGG